MTREDPVSLVKRAFDEYIWGLSISPQPASGPCQESVEHFRDTLLAELAASPADGAGVDESLIREAVEYGYQRGNADTTYSRGYRPTLAAANFLTEVLARETIRTALEGASDGKEQP